MTDKNNTILAELKRIMRESGESTLKAQSVLESARSLTSPLHGLFEWDDSSAAEQWRLEQAREIIRSVKVKIEPNSPQFVRAFVSLPSDRVEGGYRETVTVLKDSNLAAELHKDIMQRIESWKETARELGLEVDFTPMLEVASRVQKAA